MQAGKGFCLQELINLYCINFIETIYKGTEIFSAFCFAGNEDLYSFKQLKPSFMDTEHNLLENELLIDNISQTHLKETAMWTKFLAITGFVLGILIAVGAVFIGTMFNKLSGGLPGGKEMGTMAGGMIMVVYLFVAAIAFFMSFFLFKFSVKMQTALKANDQETLNLSFQNLKNYYRFAGIITILYLVILLLALIGGIIAAMLGR